MFMTHKNYRQRAVFRTAIALIGLIAGLWSIWSFPSSSSTHRAVVGSWVLFTMVCALLSFALEDWYRTVEYPQSHLGRFVKHSGLLSLVFTMFFLINITVLLLLTVTSNHA